MIFSFTPSPLALLCLKGNSSHKEVVKQLSGKVLGVFWRSKGAGKGEGRRWEPFNGGKVEGRKFQGGVTSVRRQKRCLIQILRDKKSEPGDFLSSLNSKP